jgi:hypothetical protein
MIERLVPKLAAFDRTDELLLDEILRAGSPLDRFFNIHG